MTATGEEAVKLSQLLQFSDSINESLNGIDGMTYRTLITSSPQSYINITSCYAVRFPGGIYAHFEGDLAIAINGYTLIMTVDNAYCNCTKPVVTCYLTAGNSSVSALTSTVGAYGTVATTGSNNDVIGIYVNLTELPTGLTLNVDAICLGRRV